jgi:hypothetical protein
MLTLERFCYGTSGVFGRLRMPEHEWFTCERRWFDNKPYESCIPEGVYPLEPSRYFRKGYDTFEIANVPNRSRILIHVANRPREVLGCVGVGLKLGVLEDEWAVLSSQLAFDEFMAAMAFETSMTIKVTHREGDGIWSDPHFQ